MVRSLYSGVSGMKAHQSKMDTIGNNISNVNTYGFKSSRVTFSDVFYQATGSASAPSANAGGVNPSEIGYGAILGSVDVLHGTSTMQTTANALDVGITGEGFFQVQDSEGNTFYTRAGLLDIDAYGNLVDVNGNFVLGVSGSPLGQGPSSNRIQISIPNVAASPSSATNSVNGVQYTISSSNNTKDANLSMTLIEGSDLPIGQAVAAVITSGGITVSINPNSEFASAEDLNSAINSAITSAYGGTHPGGTYTIALEPETAFDVDGLTGAEILGSNFGIKEGTIKLTNDFVNNFGFGDISTGTSFGVDFPSAEADITSQWTVERLYTKTDEDNDDDVSMYNIKVVIDGCTYSQICSAEQLSSGTESLLLVRGTYAYDGVGDKSKTGSYTFTSDPTTNSNDPNDTITIAMPSASKLDSAITAHGTADSYTSGVITSTDSSITASAPSLDLGLSGSPFQLIGGTAGGAQGIEDLTGIAIGGDGIIYGNHSVHGLMELGRIDLATFSNPQGLSQVGSTYFIPTVNSGEAQLATAGTDGTGALASACLEMSNVDLSGEMADMITTQRGFQANSRMITVSDTMLEELINLKR